MQSFCSRKMKFQNHPLLLLICSCLRIGVTASPIPKEIFSNILPVFTAFEQIFILHDGETSVVHSGEGFHNVLSAVITRAENIDDALGPTHFLSTAVIISPQNVTSAVDWIQKVFNGNRRRWQYFYFIKWPPGSTVEDLRKSVNALKLNIPLHSDVYWLLEIDNGNVTLWETYSVKGISFFQPIMLPLDEILTLRLCEQKWRQTQRANFHGVTIIGTAEDDTAFSDEVKFKTDSSGNKVFDKGFAVDVFRIYRDHLNFTEKDIEGEYMLDDEPEKGLERMQTQLQQGTADLSITLTPVAETLASQVNFIHPISSTWLEARYVEHGFLWRFFTSPFDWNVWVVIPGYVGVMVAFASIFRWVLRRAANGCMDEVGSHSVDSNLLWMVGTLCQQGWYDWPNSTSMRLVLLVASTTGFLLNAAYSGALTSQLSTKPKSTIALTDLLDMEYDFFLETQEVFPIDIDKFPRWRNTKFEEMGNVTAATDILSKMTQEKAAFVALREYYFVTAEAANLTEREACELCTYTRAGYTPSVFTMAVNKTSELKEVLNFLTLKLKECGVLSRLYKMYKRSKAPTCETESVFIVPQTISQLFLAYAVLASGFIIGLLLLVVEIVLWRMSHGTKF